ncbi:SRPBCC family protein [candidate division KSB1 bacterium]|nr:SRPBCC family protein [candidate division KSB1 bacterium]
MKVLKTIIFIILALILLFLIVALFLPSSYTLERSTEIKQPVEAVYNTVLDYDLRLQWDPWLAKDSTATTDIMTGDSTGVGAKWSWDGKIVGAGFEKVENVVPYEKIDAKLQFTRPQEMASDIVWNFEPLPEGTKVTWTISGNLGYPFERYMGLMMESFLGKDFEHGLQSLKELIEK